MYTLTVSDPDLLGPIWHMLEDEPCIPASKVVENFRISDEHSIIFVRYKYGGDDAPIYAHAASAETIQSLRSTAQQVDGSINGYLRANISHPKDSPAAEFVKFPPA